MILADRAGIRVFATGGIGGVHRGGAASLDVSADLIELGRTPVAVVCSGAKAILDLPRTREVLETQGVPVVGYGTDALPAFHARDSGLACDLRVDSAAEAAAVLHRHWALGLGGAVIANPVPADAAVPEAELRRWVDQAVADAEKEGITGAAVTPFLLDRLVALSDGRTLAANRALLIANAEVAAAIAVALAR
jgi:pseudouridine-5'-phosphate glycosidase